MSRRAPSLLETLVLLPWWVGLILAGVLYWVSGMTAVFAEKSPVIAAVVPMIAKVMAFLCLLAAGISAIRSAIIRRTLNRQDSLESLAKLHWKAFEDVLAEVFRRQGYSVDEQLGGGPDGGVDLVLRRGGKVTLVQCKRWTGKSVGASIVRELFGIMASEKADAGILVTTATFTKECEAFARGKPVRLIDGETLLPLVRGVQNGKGKNPNKQPSPEQPRAEASPPICKLCGKPMVLRTAKKGPNAGGKFWGCPNFPRCRHSENITDVTKL